jgi:hypothetical protein
VGFSFGRFKEVPAVRAFHLLSIDTFLLFWADFCAAQGTLHEQSCANLFQIEFATASHAKHYTSLFIRQLKNRR